MLAPRPLSPARWGAPDPWLSLAIAGLAGAARRGELAGRGSAKRRGLKGIGPLLKAPAEACFPPAELDRGELAWAAAVEADLIDNRGEPGGALEAFFNDPPRTRLEHLLLGLARALKLEGFHDEVLELGRAALAFLAAQPRTLGLDAPLRGGLLLRLRERLRAPSAGEESGAWGSEELLGAAWPVTAPLLEALGWVVIGRDHLDAPCCLRSTPFFRGLVTAADAQAPRFEARGESAWLDFGPGALSAALGWSLFGALSRVGDGAELSLSRAALIAGGRAGAEAAMAGLADAEAARSWLSQGPVARPRSWFVIELSSAEAADRLAAHPVMERRLLDRVTPTVLLLFGPESLDEPLRQVFQELGIALDG